MHQLFGQAELDGQPPVKAGEFRTHGTHIQRLRQLFTGFQRQVLAVKIAVAVGHEHGHTAAALVSLHNAAPLVYRLTQLFYVAAAGAQGVGCMPHSVKVRVAAAVGRIGTGLRDDGTFQINTVKTVRVHGI